MRHYPIRAAFAAFALAAIAPVANAATWGLPQSSLFQHQGPYDNTGNGPQQSGLEGGGG
ncbi:MAG TPA: hypothetical protein VE690_03360 [Rhodopila sp.]|nr:hypothetical protein [Rhodopila sp.]